MREPRTVERAGKAPIAAGRIAVYMASPKARREDRERLTEYVNVIAFTPRNRHLLMSCSKGQVIAAVGGVTLEISSLPDGGGERINRTLIIEDMYSAAGSIQPKGVHPADMDGSLKSRMNEAAELMPDEPELPEGETPVLD